MQKQVNVLRVRENANLPLKRSNIYKLHCLKKFPKLIYSVPGAGLVFDMAEWEAMVEAAKAESVRRAERIHRPIEG